MQPRGRRVPRLRGGRAPPRDADALPLRGELLPQGRQAGLEQGNCRMTFEAPPELLIW